jgi:hypothetical protein
VRRTGGRTDVKLLAILRTRLKIDAIIRTFTVLILILSPVLSSSKYFWIIIYYLEEENSFGVC